MNKFMSLLKTQFNARYGFSLAKYNMKNNKKALWKGIGIGFAVLFAFADIGFMYTFLMVQMFKAAQSINAPQLVLTLGAVIAGLLILFLGIFYIIGALFLAKDTELLSSLPLSQGSIFLSKFLLVILSEIPFALFLMLPPVIIYGVGTGKGVVYYLVALVCSIIIPLIPLAVSSILSLGLMRIVSHGRRRDLMTIIGSIVLIVVIVVGQNYFLARMPGPESGRNVLADFLSNSNGMVAIAGRAFPPSVWITRALSLTGWEAVLNLIYFILSTAAALGVVYLIASFIYLRGASAQLETEKKNHKIRFKYESSSPVRVMFAVEWRNILRTPIYALNSMAGIIMGPIIMCMPLFGGNFTKDAELKALFDLIEKSSDSPALILILAGILTLCASINPAVASTFSREGKGFWMLKNIPVEPSTQVVGKLLAGYSISFLCVITTSILMTIAFKLSLAAWFLSVLTSAVALVPICALSMLIDLKKPKLTWGNPQEAIKQNMNVILGMFVGFAFIAIFALAGFGLLQLSDSQVLICGIILLVLAAVAVLSTTLLRKAADEAYRKIEA